VEAGWKVVFIDESIFSVKAYITKGIFKIGSKPTVKYIHTREKICVLGGLSESFFTSQMADNLDNTTYLPFVKSLIRKYGKVVIIIDGAKYHFEKEHVKKYYGDNEDKLKVIQLPAYSPELNPIEQVWKKIKKWLAIRIWYTVEEMETQLIYVLNNPDFMVKIYDYYLR